MGIFELFLQSSCYGCLPGALVVLLLIFVVSSCNFSSKKDLKEPPGPKPLPLLGNLLQLDNKKPHKTFLELSKKYGPVFTLYMGPRKVVILAGYKTVKKALVNYGEEFGDRDQMKILHEFNQGHGIIWSNGESWKEMRRFALSNLRDFGMGKKACEDKIIEESQHLVGVLKNFKGEAVDLNLSIYCAILNIICLMVYGYRFEYGDPVFITLVDSIRKRMDLMFSPSVKMYNHFPWLLKWIRNRKEFHRLSAVSKDQNLKLFSQAKKTLDPQKCRGFVDAFLAQKQNLEESGITNSHFHNDNLLHSVMNLFTGGTDTTANTLRWGLLFLTKYPKIQDQVQEELRRVIGSRQVQIEDRKNLPFTNAVVHETQRLANVAPMALPHKTTQDVTFEGHFIKKGTTVYPLLSSVLSDDTEWERPQTFHPSHFLDKDGKFVKRDAFMPFSAGCRACPGESLAKMELFIFMGTLLQHFNFTPRAGVSTEEIELPMDVQYLACEGEGLNI